MQYAEDILTEFNHEFNEQADRNAALIKLAQKVKSNSVNQWEKQQFDLLLVTEEDTYQKLMSEKELIKTAICELAIAERSRFGDLVEQCQLQIKILENPDFARCRKPKDIFECI